MEPGLFDIPADLTPLLAAGLPEITGTYVVQLASRALHILSAIILVGGLFYLRTVLSPAGAEACFAGRRHVWARWVGISTGLLVASGTYNLLVIMNQTRAEESKLPGAYLTILLIKFLLALLVMFIAAILAGKTEAADRFRTQIGKWLNIAWLAAVGIVVLAAMLRTFHQ